MAAIQPPFHGAINPDSPLVGEGLSSVGGPLVIVNSDVLLVTQFVNDPWLLKNAGTPDASGENIFPMVVPEFGAWLELYHVYRHSVAPVVLTSPTVKVYGLLPKPTEAGPQIDRGGATSLKGRLWPSDVDSAWGPFTVAAGKNQERDWWQILVDPDDPTVIDLGFGIADQGWQHSTAAPTVVVAASLKTRVQLASVKEIIVMIASIAVFTAGTAGMIMARITSDAK